MIRNLAAKGFPLAIYDASAERANGVRGALLQELKLPAEVFRFCVCVHASVSVSASHCAFGCVWYMYVHPIIYAMGVEDTRVYTIKHNSTTNTIQPTPNTQAITVAQTVPELAQRCRQVCVSLPSEKVGEKVYYF